MLGLVVPGQLPILATLASRSRANYQDRQQQKGQDRSARALAHVESWKQAVVC